MKLIMMMGMCSLVVSFISMDRLTSVLLNFGLAWSASSASFLLKLKNKILKLEFFDEFQHKALIFGGFLGSL